MKLLPDPDKYGWTVPELFTDLPQIDGCQQVKLSGLMAIPPLGLTSTQAQAFFESLPDLRDRINQEPGLRLQLSELSMGMSGDFESAVEAGATMVRLGTLLFGRREP